MMLACDHQHRRVRLLPASACSLTILSLSVIYGVVAVANALSMSATANPRRASSPSHERVAVIGGGVAGLSCAKHLTEANAFSEVVVFDTGRLRPGGRCSSRSPGDPPADRRRSASTIVGSRIVDHAAQIVSVSTQRDTPFRRQVLAWEKEGVLRRFPAGSVCEILPADNDDDDVDDDERSFRLRSLNDDDDDDNVGRVMYHGVGGMGSIPTSLVSQCEDNDGDFELFQDVWISPSNGVRHIGKGGNGGNDGAPRPLWRVSRNGERLGDFHRLVVAHNGKCADRLMSKTPAKALHSLLRTNFAPSVNPRTGGKRMTLNSIYSLTFAVRRSTMILPDHVVSAFVRNEPDLRFVGCNTRRHGVVDVDDDVEVWTVLSSPAFGKRHKGPQENLPRDLVANVTSLLLASVERSLDLGEGALGGEDVVLDARLQLWGAAVPVNTWRVAADADTVQEATGFLYDSEHAVGACGDWLLESSVEGAWESGRRLANWMTRARSGSVGLPPDGGRFRASKAVSRSGIGHVAGG